MFATYMLLTYGQRQLTLLEAMRDALNPGSVRPSVRELFYECILKSTCFAMWFLRFRVLICFILR